MDYRLLRQTMVRDHLVARGLRDRRVLEAFGKVPREHFLRGNLKVHAYEDRPLPIGEGQTISQPYIVALMTEALELDAASRVLEIGTGSGYQTAILAELAGSVYTVEKIPALLAEARETLARLGYLNIRYRHTNGTLGWEEHAPYDAIIVTAASPILPPPLHEQLVISGRLVVPVGEAGGQDLIRIRKTKTGFEEESLGSVRFVPLIGRYGWKD